MSAPQPVRDADVPTLAERIRGEVEGVLRRLLPADADHVAMHYVRRRTRQYDETVWEMSVRSRTPREASERPARRWPRG